MTAAAATMPQPNMLAAALGYAGKGWPVFPCEYPTPTGCSCKDGAECGSIGKHPRTLHGFKDGTTDEATIRTWWRKTPQANIGLWCRDFVALDVDPRNGGNESLENLLSTKSDTFDFGTLEAVTGGGGSHYLFTAPDFRVKSKEFVEGIDLKAEGGYVVVAPSIHPSGRRYEWVDPDIAPVPMPEWLLTLIRDSQGADKVSSFVPRQSDGPAFDMAAFIERYVKPMDWEISGPSPSPAQIGGMAWDIKDGCPFDRSYVGGNPRFGVNASGAAFFKCFCCNDKYHWADFRDLVMASPRTGAASTDNAWPAQKSAGFMHNDSGNANRLVLAHGNDLIWCEERKAFGVWTGSRWKLDKGLIPMKMAHRVLLAGYAEAEEILDDTKRKNFLKFLSLSLNRGASPTW